MVSTYLVYQKNIYLTKILFVFKANTMSKLLLISNLLLGEKLVRASAPKILNSLGEFGGNPWDALRASRILASEKPSSSILVRREGFEPS